MRAHYGSQTYPPLDLSQSGSTPGLLDPSQTERILREPHSRLIFASFDPLTASGQGASLNFAKMSLDEEMYRPKRVVVEFLRDGQSNWRFVPRAKLDQGVRDEGYWPRVIDICGQLVHCSQEQWDIYKLDPFYQCLVKAYPSITTIVPKETSAPRPPSPLRKRPHSNSSSSSSTPCPAPKKVHYDASVTMRSVSSLTSEDSIDERDANTVEMIITDDEPSQPSSPPAPAPPPRATTPKPIKRPRQAPSRETPRRNVHRNKPYSQAQPAVPFTDSNFYSQSRQSHSMPPESQKRKDTFSEPMDISHSRIEEETENEGVSCGPSRKRPHISAEDAVERKLSSGSGDRRQARRREKDEKKRKRWEEERQEKIEARNRKLQDEVMADVPPPSVPEVDGSDKQSMDAEAAHAASILESTRRMAQLQEEERLAREKTRQEETRRQAEDNRRGEEQLRKVDRERHRQREREEQEKEERKRQEAQQRDEFNSKLCREREARGNRWNSGRWSNSRAMERFAENSDYFEMTRFSDQHPLTVEDVPWPTLLHPTYFSVEDVDWASVEQFFEVLKTHLRTQEYISIVEKSHRRFHPDRWRSRNLFKAILDPAERNCMEVAATTVSQALTPIWQKVRAIKQA